MKLQRLSNVWISSLVLGAACILGPTQPTTAPTAVETPDPDEQQLAQIEQRRAAVKAQPGSPRAARAFGQAALAAFVLGTVKRGAVDGKALAREASSYLDAAAKARPEETASLMVLEGDLWIRAGDHETGIAAVQESLDAQVTITGAVVLLAAYESAGQLERVLDACKTLAPQMSDDENRYQILDACIKHSQAASVEGGLAWASPEDVEFYKQRTAQLEAERATRTEARQRELDEWHERKSQETAQQAKERSACVRECSNVHTLCKSNCGGAVSCKMTCENDRDNCKRRC